MVYCEKMNKQKIAEHLKELDSLVFKLRMATTALQGEIYESVIVSSESQPEFVTGRDLGDEHTKKSTYGTVPLDKHDEVEASLVEPRYTGEAALTDIDDPDGFHGKSYADYERSVERSRVLPE